MESTDESVGGARKAARAVLLQSWGETEALGLGEQRGRKRSEGPYLVF